MKGRNRNNRHRVSKSLRALSVQVQPGPARPPVIPSFRVEGAPRQPVTVETYRDLKPVPRPIEHYPGINCPAPSNPSDLSPGQRDFSPVSNRRTWRPRYRLAAAVTGLSSEEARVLTSVWG